MDQRGSCCSLSSHRMADVDTFPSSSCRSSPVFPTPGFFWLCRVALGTSGAPLSSSDRGELQSSWPDSASFAGAILWSISSIFFCRMLRSVDWLGDAGDCTALGSTGGLGLTLVCRGGSFEAGGGLGLRDGCVGWGLRGGSGGGRTGGGSVSQSVSPNSGGGGSSGMANSSRSASGLCCCVARLAALEGPAGPSVLGGRVVCLAGAGPGSGQTVGVCVFSTADFELSSLMLLEVRKEEACLGLTAAPLPCGHGPDLCLSLSLAAMRRVRGEAAAASRDAPPSPPFRLRSLRSNKGLNLPAGLGGP